MNQPADLEGQVAVVTGGARGIGQAIAVELARCGADILVNDVQPETQAQETLAVIASLGRRAAFVQGDVGKRPDAEAMIAAAVSQFGKVDILVNNAGFGFRRPLIELAAEDAERVFNVIVWGAFHCTQLAARRMIEQKRGGSIVMISSVHASRPYPTASIYNGAKAAVNHMACTWAIELAEHGIRVNVIEPGWIDTPGERVRRSDEVLRAEGAKLLMKRLGRPDEIAQAAAFLASEKASYITGSILRVDGGYAITR